MRLVSNTNNQEHCSCCSSDNRACVSGFPRLPMWSSGPVGLETTAVFLVFYRRRGSFHKLATVRSQNPGQDPEGGPRGRPSHPALLETVCCCGSSVGSIDGHLGGFLFGAAMKSTHVLLGAHVPLFPSGICWEPSIKGTLTFSLRLKPHRQAGGPVWRG